MLNRKVIYNLQIDALTYGRIGKTQLSSRVAALLGRKGNYILHCNFKGISIERRIGMFYNSNIKDMRNKNYYVHKRRTSGIKLRNY